jgi:hypothetical protein
VKLFFIEIGRFTRKGTFVKHHQRAVSVEGRSYNDVHNYFSKYYVGFDIKVSEAEALEDLSGVIQARHLSSNEERGKLSGFRIKHTEEEKFLYAEYLKLKEQMNKKLDELEDSIIERYKKLSYVRPYRNNLNMILKTDDNGTYCQELPIKSEDFFRVVKDCIDDSETLVIEQKTNIDDDIPY